MADQSIQAVLKDGFVRHSRVIETTGSTLEADPLLADLAAQIDEAGEADLQDVVLWALDSPDCPYVAEALQYFGHRFRWDWLKAEINANSTPAQPHTNLRRMRYYEVMLEAFDDDWEDIDLYPFLEVRRRGDA